MTNFKLFLRENEHVGKFCVCFTMGWLFKNQTGGGNPGNGWRLEHWRGAP